MYQFGQYAWTHLILLFVFIPSSFFVSNIFDGIIWFLLPCSLVIANDIFAYLSGDSSPLLNTAYAGRALCLSFRSPLPETGAARVARLLAEKELLHCTVC